MSVMKEISIQFDDAMRIGNERGARAILEQYGFPEGEIERTVQSWHAKRNNDLLRAYRDQASRAIERRRALDALRYQEKED